MTHTACCLTSRGMLGVMLIATGILALCANIFYNYDFWDFWPLLLVVWGLVRFANYRGRRAVFSFGLILVGIWLTLENTNPWFYVRYLEWDYVWPLALVFFGVYLIIRNLRMEPANIGSTSSEADNINLLAFLGGNTARVSSKNFQGGSAMALMGGVEVDLREAALPGDSATVTIDATAIMGGVEVFVPTSWAVRIKGTPILGSIEDQRANPPRTDDTRKTLVIDGLAVMGSIEIKQ